MKRLSFGFGLTVVAPFLFRGVDAGAFGLDATQMRDAEGNPILPADQARGVLKEALVDIAAAAPSVISFDEIHRLFGLGSAAAEDGEQDRPDRGLISVSDLVAAQSDALPRSEETVVRVEIDDATGAARRGHIQFIEGVAATGAEVTFRGRLVIYWQHTDEQRISDALGKAAQIIEAVGAFKSVGFGRVARGEIARDRDSAFPPPAAIAVKARHGFALRFDRPYLVDAERVVDNAFVGRSIVPGAVIKGALARKIELMRGSAELERLGEALSRVVISHAFPEDAAGQPGGERVPLSTVAAMNKSDAVERLVLGDDLRLDGVVDGPGPFLEGQPASFPSDWKASWWEKSDRALGRAPYQAPVSLPRTRTRIDEETGSARDEALFTSVARSHVKLGSKEARRFLFTFDCGGTPDSAASELLDLLRGGLDFVGKTDASATIESWPEGDVAPKPRAVRGHPDLYVVRLRTSAVLVDPRTEAMAAQAYSEYWRDVADAELVDFCASQTLAGGYLATRRRPWPGTYHPFVLTDAGSVFLLRGNLAGRLEQLIRSGLPLPRFAEARELSWRNCPFVPGNGYGEIRADHLAGEDFERITRVERARHG